MHWSYYSLIKPSKCFHYANCEPYSNASWYNIINYGSYCSHRDTCEHWNENVIILMKFSSLAAPKVVKMTTFSAASDENFVKMMTFPFQWRFIIDHTAAELQETPATSASRASYEKNNIVLQRKSHLLARVSCGGRLDELRQRAIVVICSLILSTSRSVSGQLARNVDTTQLRETISRSGLPIK